MSLINDIIKQVSTSIDDLLKDPKQSEAAKECLKEQQKKTLEAKQEGDGALDTCLVNRKAEADTIYQKTPDMVHEFGKQTEEIIKEYAACLQLLPNTQNAERCFLSVRNCTLIRFSLNKGRRITARSDFDMLIVG